MIDRFFEFKEQLDKMMIEAKAVRVYDAPSLGKAEEMIAQAKKLENAISKRRAEVTRPLLDSKKKIDGVAKVLTERIGAIRKTIDGQSIEYLKKLERERLEKEKKAREAMAKAAREAQEREEKERIEAAAKAQAEADEFGYSERDRQAAVADAVSAVIPAAPEIVEVVVDDRTKVTTESGSATVDYKYTGELTDIKKLPDDIIKARWKQIQAAVQPEINHRIKSGTYQIPGVKIKREQVIKRRVR
jgi:hypothetical protein